MERMTNQQNNSRFQEDYRCVFGKIQRLIIERNAMTHSFDEKINVALQDLEKKRDDIIHMKKNILAACLMRRDETKQTLSSEFQLVSEEMKTSPSVFQEPNDCLLRSLEEQEDYVTGIEQEINAKVQVLKEKRELLCKEEKKSKLAALDAKNYILQKTYNIYNEGTDGAKPMPATLAARKWISASKNGPRRKNGRPAEIFNLEEELASANEGDHIHIPEGVHRISERFVSENL